MTTVNRFSAESYTNEFGQVINPGEEVIFAGTGRAYTRLLKAVFDGVYYGKQWNSDKEEIVAVRCGGIAEKKLVWDEPWDRNKKWDEQKYHYEPFFRKAILPLKRVYKLDMTVDKFDGKYF
jgi:hypothetical protein